MLADRVQCSTATTGTGTVTLGAATPGHRTFAAAFAAARTVSYVIVDGTAWETGRGTYDPATNALTRELLTASSTPGSRIGLSGTAVVSVAFLAADHVPDWPVLIVSGQAADLNSHAGAFQYFNSSSGFTTVGVNTVSVDTHGGFDTATSLYTVPQTGIYDCQGKFRLNDATPSGVGFGIGLDVANQDSPGFQWNATISSNYPRHGGYNSRLMYLTAGQLFRLFVYVDSAQTRGAITAELTMIRVR